MSSPDRIGDLIGERYEIKRSIGEGGMQYVYEAHDNLVKRKVALKTPKNKSAEKRFNRSAIVAAKVNHPNVAKTLDYIEENGDLYLIEELVVGENLDDALLKRTNFLDPYSAAKVFHHLAKGVAAAHHAGVVHRDLKPTNVMIVGGYSLNELKITDFGIAKMADAELAEAVEGGNDSMTASQTLVGALPYMAPEAIDSPRNVQYPADIWSVGAMMFQLISGELPYGQGLSAVRKIQDAEKPIPPNFLTSNSQFSPLTNHILEIIYTCLQRRPELRPSADELVHKCGDLCYTHSPRKSGVVKKIFYNGANGFIETDGEDVFFHSSAVYGLSRIAIGDRVIFASYDGTPRKRAFPVLIEKTFKAKT